MATKTEFKVKRTVFINKKTGQASIALPMKAMKKLFLKMPKKIVVKVRPVKW